MVTNRTDPAAESRSAPGTAFAETPAADPAPGPGGFKAWLPLLITVIVMPLLAYVMTSFVLLPRLQKSLGLPVAARQGAGPPGEAAQKKESVAFNKLLVNVAGTMGARYLLVSIALAGTDTDFKTKVQDFEPQLRDMACGTLRLKTLADLEKPTAQNLLRSELISGFNRILGGPVVTDIYFTEFAIQ